MQKPIELAYALSLIHSFIQNKNIHSITPPWVLKKYPDVEQIIHRLRNTPCITGCKYCNEVLDIHKGLRKYFGYDSYRTFGGEALQEKAVLAAINNKSILAVFPTGGGKSITFQVPALMSGQNSKGLTVIISPLQLSLIHILNFDSNKLTMLASKTTCKDRWRQILNEADRIKIKHLFTLQQGISKKDVYKRQDSDTALNNMSSFR